MDESSPKSSDCLLNGGHANWIEEILKVLLLPFDNILSLGQQYSIQVKHNLGRSLLSLSELSNGSPEHP